LMRNRRKNESSGKEREESQKKSEEKGLDDLKTKVAREIERETLEELTKGEGNSPP